MPRFARVTRSETTGQDRGRPRSRTVRRLRRPEHRLGVFGGVGDGSIHAEPGLVDVEPARFVFVEHSRHPVVPHDEFLERRANAYQAYFEHQPLRLSRMPDGPNLPLYRRFSFGSLLEFNILDTRQYRDDIVKSEEKTEDPDRTILGDEQEHWLLKGFKNSDSTWNVLANQVLMAEIDISNDRWDGYKADL